MSHSGRGGRAPNTPFPAARPEGGGVQILGAGRASVASLSRPHGRLPAAPQPRAAAPTCSPDSSSPLEARAEDRLSTRWGQCDAAGPGWNKVLRPGAGLLPAPGAPRAGSLQTQSEPGSKRESKRESERAGEFDESSAQPPPESLGSLGSVTYLSGPAAQCGLRPVSPHGAWGSLGSQPGPAVTRRDCPCAPRRS